MTAVALVEVANLDSFLFNPILDVFPGARNPFSGALQGAVEEHWSANI